MSRLITEDNLENLVHFITGKTDNDRRILQSAYALGLRRAIDILADMPRMKPETIRELK